MPDRQLVANMPVKGMVFRYTRTGRMGNERNWVVTIERIERDKIIWLWVKDVKTYDEAMRMYKWNQETEYDLDDWQEWLLNTSGRWGECSVTILSPASEPTWEV